MSNFVGSLWQIHLMRVPDTEFKTTGLFWFAIYNIMCPRTTSC